MPLFQPAVKERLRARVAIDGPTGAGKTWTALQWARIIVGPDGPIGVIDTEQRSAAYYAVPPKVTPERLNWWDPPYVFGHYEWVGPYEPNKLRDLIIAAGAELGPDGCLVIDSGTHFWSGEGGTLDQVDAAKARSRSHNSFTDGWSVGTPMQRGMVDAMLKAPCHVIMTMRSKMSYVLEEREKDGKKFQAPVKLGLSPEQRAGIEYEFTLVIDMDLEHTLTVGKSRCDEVADVVAPKGRSHEVAQTFAEWLATGVERIAPEIAGSIVDRFRAVADEARRRELWDSFVAVYGRPAEITVDKLDEVGEWLAKSLPAAEGDKATEPPASAPANGDGEAAPATPPASTTRRRSNEPQRLGGALADALDAATTQPDFTDVDAAEANA